MKLIEKIFGKPYQHNLFKFFYWFAVVLYIIGIPSIILMYVLTDSIEILINNLVGLCLYPFMFRLVYGVNAYLYKIVLGDIKRKD